VAKVGTSNRDRIISLEDCSAQVENNNSRGTGHVSVLLHSIQLLVYNGYRNWLFPDSEPRRIITADTNQSSTIGTIFVKLPSCPLNPH
jgi:hypothetical protein